jgi:hypothetical protein
LSPLRERDRDLAAFFFLSSPLRERVAALRFAPPLRERERLLSFLFPSARDRRPPLRERDRELERERE